MRRIGDTIQGGQRSRGARAIGGVGALGLVTAVALVAASLCTHTPTGRFDVGPARVAHDAQPVQLAENLEPAMRWPGGATETPSKLPPTALPEAAKTVPATPRRDGALTAKVVRPELPSDTRIWPPVEGPIDIYAPLDAEHPPLIYDPPQEPRLPRRVLITPPLPSPDRRFPEPSFSMAALGVGAAGLGLAAIGVVAAQDRPTEGALIFSSVSLAIGVGAFAIGGIVYLIEAGETEKTRVGIGPGALVVDGSF